MMVNRTHVVCVTPDMKTKLFTFSAFLAAAVTFAQYGKAAPLPEKADMLATNTVVAKYVDTVDIPCRFMTTLCPDKCNHATKLAQFEVLSNENYEHPGQYGDEKLEKGSIASVDVKKDIPGQSPEVAKLISELKPGDEVKLTITHYYVQQGQGHFPVRPAVSIERVPAAK